MSVELGDNPLFQVLLKRFIDVYRRAGQEGWLVCVPVLNNPIKLNRNLVLMHVLKPSPLLKQHFIPYIKCDIDDIELENNSLIITRAKSTQKEEVKIIKEEIAFTQSNKISLFIIERPLIKLKPPTKSKLKGCLKDVKNDSDNSSNTDLRTFEDCVQYLKKKSPKVTQEMLAKSLKLMSTYHVLPNYLEDSAQEFKAIADWGAQQICRVNSIQDVYPDDVCIAAESFVIAVNNDAIFKQVQNRYQSEDSALERKFTMMENLGLTMSDLGAQEYFHNLVVPEEISQILNDLRNKQTPLEKIYSFKSIYDLINESLTHLTLFTSNPLEKRPKNATIMSDDVLAATIYCLIKVKPPKLASHMNHINIFSWKLPSKNELAYATVTFQAAIGFIMNYEVKDHTHNRSDSGCSMDFLDSSSNSYSSGRKTRIDTEIDRIQELMEQTTVSNDGSSVFSEPTLVDASDESIVANGKNAKLGSFLSLLKRSQFVVHSGKQS
ncbi:uncharacterized protein LOC141856453 [Brevipalpus obovatus]|uniref:uncharacterized protein LOC141856453 n=1 Tax=Brevipalpus obovatus TaxID=246614 RepID=UPI003D9E2FA0